MQSLPDTQEELLVLSLVLLAAGAANRPSARSIQVSSSVFYDSLNAGYPQLQCYSEQPPQRRIGLDRR